MLSGWRIEILGGLRAVAITGAEDAVAVRFPANRTGALLASLSLGLGRFHFREELVERIWPDEAPETARHRLRQSLLFLRRQLEPPNAEPSGLVLQSDRSSVWLNPQLVSVDVHDFQEARRNAIGATTDSDRVLLHERAVSIYRGELLPGIDMPWAATEREIAYLAVVDSLRRLAALHESAGDLGQAVERAMRLVTLEPLDEVAGLLLIRLLVRSEQRHAARLRYDKLRHALKRAGLPLSEQARQEARLLLQEQRVLFGESTPSPQMDRFRERAQRARLAGPIREGEIGSVRLICQLLDGDSLLIDLCAAWCATMTTARIEKRLTELLGTTSDKEERQRLVLETSFGMLPHHVQYCVLRLLDLPDIWSMDQASSAWGAGTVEEGFVQRSLMESAFVQPVANAPVEDAPLWMLPGSVREFVRGRRDAEALTAPQRRYAFEIVRAGDVPALTALLDSGFDVNTRLDPTYNTLLLTATYWGRREAVELLLECGADVNCVQRTGSTPLLNAAYFGHINLIPLLLKAGARLDARTLQGETPLVLAENMRQWETADYLRAHGGVSPVI